ncbi:glycosyltransferase [Pseudomonas chengduensis]|nr:glycosyltransferase [Pseudomonas chengduensis]MDH1683278.1 glycosyltransferase [Pseudomonas chengduensis]
MNRRNVFIFLRFMHLALDRSLSSIFGSRFRQSYIRMSYRIKTSLFPEYGAYIPTSSEIGQIPQRVIWMPPAIPNWVLDEMRDLARDIDPVLYPTDEFQARCQYYSFPVQPRPGQIYRELMQRCLTDHYTHCFAIPWLKRGGADLVTLKHIEVAAQASGGKVLVIMTEPGDSPWVSRIPSGVDVVDASRFAGEISHDELLLVIVRMLVQLQIDTLHIINSRHVWEIVCRYGLAVTQRTRIFASIYCDDYDRYGQPVGFARQYLPDCYRRLTTVFTDNSAFSALLRQTYGYRPDLFRVLKSPVDTSLSLATTRKPEGRKVLWAGRLDRQKRPDLLLAIAQALPDVEFHVYGDAVLDYKTGVVGSLQKLKNVRMLGSFDGVERLPFADFPVFLYTSQWDGTPTMIIAAALASIPIVASCVGGVGDIVTEARGYPVTDTENVALYVARINEALDNQMSAEEKAAAAREYVKCEHSDAAFTHALATIQGYMPRGTTTEGLEPCSA